MYLGLDFGTSGARACVVDEAGIMVHQDRISGVGCACAPLSLVHQRQAIRIQPEVGRN